MHVTTCITFSFFFFFFEDFVKSWVKVWKVHVLKFKIHIKYTGHQGRLSQFVIISLNALCGQHTFLTLRLWGQRMPDYGTWNKHSKPVSVNTFIHYNSKIFLKYPHLLISFNIWGIVNKYLKICKVCSFPDTLDVDLNNLMGAEIDVWSSWIRVHPSFLEVDVWTVKLK